MIVCNDLDPCDNNEIKVSVALDIFLYFISFWTTVSLLLQHCNIREKFSLFAQLYVKHKWPCSTSYNIWGVNPIIHLSLKCVNTFLHVLLKCLFLESCLIFCIKKLSNLPKPKSIKLLTLYFVAWETKGGTDGDIQKWRSKGLGLRGIRRWGMCYCYVSDFLSLCDNTEKYQNGNKDRLFANGLLSVLPPPLIYIFLINLQRIWFWAISHITETNVHGPLLSYSLSGW